MIAFTVYGRPVPQGSMKAFVRGGRAVVTSDNAGLENWRLCVSRAANEAGRGSRVDGGESWHVTLLFVFERPKSDKNRSLPNVRPDLDKLCRAILDGITDGGLIHDDAQVVGLRAEKLYGTPERCEIEVRVV